MSHLNNKKNKVLFLANIYTPNTSHRGGAIVLAKELWHFLSKQNEISIKHLQLRHIWRSPWQIIDYLLWTIRAPFIFFRYDIISFHATQDFTFTLGPVVWMWAKLLGKQINYHFFGSNFLLKRNKLQQWLFKKTILQSDNIFVETKFAIEKLSEQTDKNLIWFPNMRKRVLAEFPKKKFKKRFVFISLVNYSKGIKEILQIAQKLPDDYTFDIYGPITDSSINEKDLNKGVCRYRGILKNDEVQNVLQNYDIVVLPTYYEGEGYPGIIIEAFSVGNPVITTKWKAVPELVNENTDAILINPKKPNELLEAILFFNNENYPVFSKNAFLSFDQFDRDIVCKKMLNTLRNDTKQ